MNCWLASVRLRRRNIEYKTIPGEAAFYGPKIDLKLVDAIGRPWQLTTVQFDFALPERFELEYVGEDGKRRQPLMVHCALYSVVRKNGTTVDGDLLLHFMYPNLVGKDADGDSIGIPISEIKLIEPRVG